jgi:hypothetical protein
MAAKARYTRLKLGIAGSTAAAVVIGAGYFASVTRQASAELTAGESPASAPATAQVPNPNAGTTSSTSGAAAAPAPAKTAPATVVPKARKSRGS